MKKQYMIPRIRLDDFYYDAESIVHDEIERNDPKVQPELMYDFFIDALGRELAATYTSSTFVEQVDAMGHLYLPEEHMLLAKKNATENRTVRFTTVNVACVPWSKHKLSKAITDVTRHGYQRDPSVDACKGILFEEIRLVIVENAHHHSAAAQMTHDETGTVQVRVLQLAPFFDTLRIDTFFRWCTASGTLCTPQHPFPPADPRFVLMYEMARRKHLLLKSKATGYDAFLKEKRIRIERPTTAQVIALADLPGLSPWKRLWLRPIGLYLCDGMVKTQRDMMLHRKSHR